MKKTPQDNDKWQIKTDVMLAVLAKQADMMTYDELANAVGVPAPHRIHKLTIYLEQLIADDVRANAPIRASVIISKIRGMPAPGFFMTLQACHLTRTTDDDALWHSQLLHSLNPAFES